MISICNSLESVRQKCIAMKRFEDYHKKHAPKGKKYVGMKFKQFKENFNGFWSMGFRAIPVFKKETL